MPNRGQLIHAIEELNQVLGLEPPIAVQKDVQAMIADLRDVAELVEPEDELSDITTEVLASFEGGEGKEEVDEEEVDEEEPEEGEDTPEEDAEDLVEEEPEPDEDEPEPKSEEVLPPPTKAEKEVFSLSVYPAGTAPIEGEVTGRPKNLADCLDEIVVEGGDWPTIMRKVEAARKQFENPRRVNRAYLRYHIYLRIQRGYLSIPLEGTRVIRVNQDGITVEEKEG